MFPLNVYSSSSWFVATDQPKSENAIRIYLF
jgi:hypothetical protein